MAAHKGIINKFGLTTPTGGFASETTRKRSNDFLETPNEIGVVAEVDAMPYATEEITMKGIGEPDFALVTAATTAAGTLKILSIKRTESNLAKKAFEITARKRINHV